MKSFNDLSIDLDKWRNRIDKDVVDAQQKTAQSIYNDVIDNAIFKVDTGVYKNSIKIDESKIYNSVIETFIGSDLQVGPTKWTGGKLYNLGYLLEHGTFEHAIPNAFGKGFYYGFTDNMGRFHKGTLDKDWHPGGIAIPHYSIALIKNKKLYKDNIKLTWRSK